MIELIGVGKSYDGGNVWAVRDVDLTVKPGEMLVLLGESGCGKTTTLKMINRLIEPTAGTLRVDGKDVLAVDPVQLRRGIGYVFQHVGLLPHLSVADNIAVLPQLLGWEHQRISDRVDELLETVNLSIEMFRDRMPDELSGGQCQRVGIARALAASPSIMLMDEPFGSLDPLTRDMLHVEMKRLHKKLNLTTVMVTHDMTEALLLADRIAVMSGGNIIRLDTPEKIMSDPRHEYVEQLMAAPRRQADELESLMKAGSNTGGDA